MLHVELITIFLYPFDIAFYYPPPLTLIFGQLLRTFAKLFVDGP